MSNESVMPATCDRFVNNNPFCAFPSIFDPFIPPLNFLALLCKYSVKHPALCCK